MITRDATGKATTGEADWSALADRIRLWAGEIGFQQVAIADIDLHEAESRLLEWLERGFHGDMDYLERHGTLRSRPADLVPGTIRVISARLNYFPEGVRDAESVMGASDLAYVSRYALGRDYHKVLRNRLQQLTERICADVASWGQHAGKTSHTRVFTDSAPVMEVELAAKAGLGWRGKHTLLLNRDAGSWFFLGEIYTDLPLPVDAGQSEHCGVCRRCIDVCPTQAIVAPYQLDARRCISYLTIEHKGSIPEALRALMGNRIYGCDDCQLACPWNKFAQTADLEDFRVRNGLDGPRLADLFAWTEAEFLARLEGSAIRRIGYERWLRNIAVALGNAQTSDEVVDALRGRSDHASALVREHVAWALAKHGASDK